MYTSGTVTAYDAVERYTVPGTSTTTRSDLILRDAKTNGFAVVSLTYDATEILIRNAEDADDIKEAYSVQLLPKAIRGIGYDVDYSSGRRVVDSREYARNFNVPAVPLFRLKLFRIGDKWHVDRTHFLDYFSSEGITFKDAQ